MITVRWRSWAVVATGMVAAGAFAAVGADGPGVDRILVDGDDRAPTTADLTAADAIADRAPRHAVSRDGAVSRDRAVSRNGAVSRNRGAIGEAAPIGPPPAAPTEVGVPAPDQTAADGSSTGTPPVAAPDAAAAPAADAGVTAGDSAVGAFWYAIGAQPSADELARVGRFDVVVLNPWETSALRRIKAVSPTTTVLAYKDLSSTRSYTAARPAFVDGARSAITPGGIAYEQAQPSWFAVDRDGRRIEWDPYPEHWQMAVWDPSYQQAWAEQVATEIAAAPWDGVLADNDFASLAFYSPAVLQGVADAQASDRRIRDGLDQLIGVAGERLAREGLLLVPNISEARLYPGRWEAHSRFGGGMEENFVRFAGAPGQGYVTDWGATGWRDVVAEAAHPDRLALLVTAAAAGDERAARYGWGSAMVAATGPVAWMSAAGGDYTRATWAPVQEQSLGAARGPREQWAPAVWAREFDGGWVLVNASESAATVTVPAGVADLTTPGGGTVTVPATDSVVLGRR